MTKDNTNNKKNRSKVKLNRIDFVQLFIVVLFFFIGMADFRYGAENYILAVLLIIWLSISFLLTPKFFKKTFDNGRYVLLLMFSFFYILPQLFLRIDIQDIFKGYFAIILVLAPFIFADYYYHKFGGGIFIKISKFLIIYYIYFSMRTINLLINNPKAARYLTYGSSAANVNEMNQFSGVGGGYDLAYALVLLTPVILYIILKSKVIYKKEKSIYIFVIILFTYAIILSDFGMAFLFLIIGILGLVVANLKGKNRLVFAGFFLLVIFLSLLLKELLGDLLIELSNSYLNNTISARLNSIGYFLNGDIRLLDISLRITRNIQSIKTFLSYPFLGASIDALYDINVLRSIHIGNHSDFFDTLAKYGIFAGVPLITYYILTIKSINKRLKMYSGSAVLTLIDTLFLLIAIFNSVSVISISVTMAWVIPGVIFMTKKYNSKLPKGN